MSKFITGKDLEDVIYDTIWQAEDILMIVSPFIKLDDYFKELFDKHENNPNIHILIVFGKNEKEITKSISKEDYEYFKKFLNVSIIYAPNLHAKYYGNEKQGVITSINLYDFSFKNNIEFGVFSKQDFISNLKMKSPDVDAWEECWKIANSNEVIFIKRPLYEKRKIIVNLGKRYVKSDVLFDSTDKFYGNSYHSFRYGVSSDKLLLDFPEILELGSNRVVRPERVENEKQTHGFCIRTRKKIRFNPSKPMCKEAWRLWNEFKNEDFPEKYCHKTGELSNGKTSFRNPIL